MKTFRDYLKETETVTDVQTEDEIKSDRDALDKFRELYRKGIGTDDDPVVPRELIKVINDDALSSDESHNLDNLLILIPWS